MITKMLFAKAALAGAVILANTPTDGGCAAPPPSGGSGDGKPKACDVRVRSGPWVYGTGRKQRITASVHAECDKAPPQHNLEVWLERDVTDSGSWLLADDQENPMRSATLPDASGFDLTATFHGCISGKWRVMAKVTGIDIAGHPINFNLPLSETRPTRLKCTL